MELRRFLLDRDIKQISVVREAVKAGILIHAPDLCAVAKRKMPASPNMKNGLVKALLALGVDQADIDQLDELKDRPDGRRRPRPSDAQGRGATDAEG